LATSQKGSEAPAPKRQRSGTIVSHLDSRNGPGEGSGNART